MREDSRAQPKHALGGGASDDAPLQEVVDGVDGAVVILLPLKCSESMETATPAADGSTTSGTLDDWLVPCEFMHRSRRVASRQRSRSYLPSSGAATTAETSQPADSVRLNRLESSALLERERRLESCGTAGRHSVRPGHHASRRLFGRGEINLSCMLFLPSEPPGCRVRCTGFGNSFPKE
jgi:hypothetical protein